MPDKFIKKFEVSHREQLDEQTIHHNLLEMATPMSYLLNNESLGGNAGEVEIEGKPYSCAAANGYADVVTGKIVAFGNFQDVPEIIRSRNQAFVFRVALDLEVVEGKPSGRGFFKIVGFYEKEFFSQNARGILEESIKLWNEKHK